MNLRNIILQGHLLDVAPQLQDESIQSIITSPPYWGTRDYGVEPVSWVNGELDSLGREVNPRLYARHITECFCFLWNKLRNDGTLWLVLGNTYCGTGYKGEHLDKKSPIGRNVGRGNIDVVNYHIEGMKQKDLVGIPWMVAFALRDAGWYLRAEIIWHKTNPMTEGDVRDRPIQSHEQIFLLSKNKHYYFNADAIREPCVTKPDGRRFGATGNRDRHDQGRRYTEQNPKGKLRRDVWTIPTHPLPRPYRGKHFAAFPEALVELCILAGSRKGDVVLDPFVGSGTTPVVAKRLGRDYVGIDLNPAYVKMSQERVGP